MTDVMFFIFSLQFLQLLHTPTPYVTCVFFQVNPDGVTLFVSQHEKKTDNTGNIEPLEVPPLF